MLRNLHPFRRGIAELAAYQWQFAFPNAILGIFLILGTFLLGVARAPLSGGAPE